MKKFDEFQLSEYENIAKAHFETIRTISVFFRYYLLIMSVPSFILVIMNGESNGLLQNSSDKIWVMFKYIFLFLPIVGFLVCMYLVSLRLDAILYARVVNGVRNYFYKICKIDEKTKKHVQVLPIDKKKPHYFEVLGFLPVVLTFALINSVYFGLFFYLSDKGLIFIHIVFIILFFCLHILGYWLCGIFKEYQFKINENPIN